MDNITEKGWKFPPTGGGVVDGFNNPGIAHFRGELFESLARETIQNSLDAIKDSEKPVVVVFELIDIPTNEIGGSELASAVRACLEVKDDEDSYARPTLEEAVKILNSDQVSCLRIYDKNTTGLIGDHWQALVKSQGISRKDKKDAGGSHCIGKYAPFAVSALRTVFYWTCFRDSEGATYEKFQGKSILRSHKSATGNETQGTGFYGEKEQCSEMTTDIPRHFQVIEEGEVVQGTNLIIAGFQDTENWRQQIAVSILANFFYAIGQGNLSVILDSSNYDADNEFQEVEINKNTMDKWFSYLENTRDIEESVKESIKRARIYSSMVKEKPTEEKQDQNLGYCRLWIRVAEDLTKTVGLVRRTGMLITEKQKNLIQFPGFRDFTALCVFEGEEGNRLLRRMENPRHDQFEPDHLPQAERSYGIKVLKTITKWIRDMIRERAGASIEGHQTALNELAVYLPLFDDQEDVFDNERDEDENQDHREKGFGERITVKLNPVRRSVHSSSPTETPEGGEDGDGPDTGNEGGGATGENGDGSGNAGMGEGGGHRGNGREWRGNKRTKYSRIACKASAYPKS